MFFAVDFDGTISLEDTIDALLEAFGNDPLTIERLEKAWIEGEITAFTCLTQQFLHLDLSKESLQAFVNSIKIDESFVSFYKEVSAKHPLIIVSDGAEDLIRPVLERYGISCPIYAGKIVFQGDNVKGIDYPYHLACENGNGTCKCAMAQTFAKQHHQGKIILIGDGRSDFCIARKTATYVYAKSGKSLSKYCKEQNLRYKEFSHFSDILDSFKEKNFC